MKALMAGLIVVVVIVLGVWWLAEKVGSFFKGGDDNG